MNKNRTYLCIDLKSFYASVECVDRGLDPMTTNLVVADSSRTEKTICLAVTPSLKSYGMSGRARLFEVVQKVREINYQRRKKLFGKKLSGESYDAKELEADPSLALSYIVAPPRMAHYMEYSTRIYDVYLKYIAPEDIHVYSIDEVFMDVTDYLGANNITAHNLSKMIIKDVYKTTGITATAGIGTNMYLAKVAMDIVAKHIQEDEYGVRIAYLDEMTYRKLLWDHRPLGDFWRVGRGYVKKLEQMGLFTMGEIARYSLSNYGEDKLYKTFGINAELLIDHAWGWEPCTIKDVKAYKPQNNSLGTGQVLHCPYDVQKAKLIVREMIELLCLDLVEKRLVTDQIVLTVGYDIECLTNPELAKKYSGEITTDFYGRKVPKHAHGTANIGKHTSSTMLVMNSVMELFDKIVDKNLLVRRINISANHIIDERDVSIEQSYKQIDFFSDFTEQKDNYQKEKELLDKERKIQEATISIKKRFGKNAILKGVNLEEGATTIDRNKQIGGHKA